MGAVLEFRPVSVTKLRDRVGPRDVGEVVIFPGVRIERWDLDLGHRVKKSAGVEDFHGLGRHRQPRKTS